MNNEIKNPYIMIDVQSDQLTEVFDAVESVLKDLEIPYEKCHDPHISLAYVIGDHSKEFLEDLVAEIAEDKFEIRPMGLKVLEGKTTDKDYIVLDLESDNEHFGYAQDLISETCDVKMFNGKFSVHLSLFKIDKNVIPKKDWFSLCRVIEMNSEFLSSMKIKGKTVAVFNQNREKEIEAGLKLEN